MSSAADPFTLDDADSLRRAVGMVVRAVRDATEATGPDESEGQIETLGFLMRDGDHSIAALARRRRVRHQSMSAIVVDLEARGFVERRADPQDARGVLITLTAQGRGVVQRSRETRSVVVRDAAVASLSPADLELLARVPALLDALTARLSTER